MLEAIPELPDHVVGIRAKGEVSREDYRTVLEPAVSAALSRHDKARLLYVIGPEVTGISPGAMFEDAKVGIEHLTRWERMAVVTDQAWIRHALHAFAWMLPAEMKNLLDCGGESGA